MRFVLSLNSIILASAMLSASATPAHYAITPAQVSVALSNVGMQVDPMQVALLSPVVATSTSPSLRVRTVESSANHTALARIECADPEQCLPFFVKIQLDASGDVSAALPQPEQNGDEPRRQNSAKPIVARAGSPAILMLDSERVHIRIPVVCVDNGAAGARIRVKGTLNQHMYTAEVVEANLLKGSLQ